MITQSDSLSVWVGHRPHSLDLVKILFLFGVLLAPLDLNITGAFTAYDAVLLVVAFLLVAGLRRLNFLPIQFTVAVCIFLSFALLGTFRASYPAESMTQILQFAFIFLVQIPVILTLVNSQFMLRMSLLFFLCGMLIEMISAALFRHVQGAGRALAFYSDNPNQLGYPTAYMLPFVLYLLFDQWRNRHLLRALIVALPILYLMLWALAASGSRSATLGTLVAAMVFLSFRRGFKINLKMMFRFLSTVAVIGLFVYWYSQSAYLSATLRDRIERTLRGESSLTYDRINLARAGLRAFADSPFIGVGLNNFKYVARQYVLQATNQDPHNLWIQFLSQIGLFGTLAFLVLMVGWFTMLFRAQRSISDQSQRELLWAFIASMAAIMTIYMFIPIMITRQYWLVYGMGLALVYSSYAKQLQKTTSL